MARGLTAFVGVNGSDKTAVMQAMLRLFGVTPEHRRLRRQDFHVPSVEAGAPLEREFVVEAILAFPELDRVDGHAAVPEFLHQMACEEDGRLKCRLRLEGRWTDDGSFEGVSQLCGRRSLVRRHGLKLLRRQLLGLGATHLQHPSASD